MTIAKVAQEHWLIERTRQLDPWFLPGDVRPAEDPPDFVLVREGERIALEVTRIFQPKGKAAFARRERESFHCKVMLRAEALAKDAGLPILDVLVYFGSRELLKLEAMAQSLV